MCKTRFASAASAISTILLLACSHKSPEQKLLKDVNAATSWVATLQFAGEKWLVNSVPRSFVRSSAGAAQKQLRKAIKTIGKSAARKDLRDALQHQFEVATAAAQNLNDGVQKNDRRLVADSVRRFAEVHAILDKLEQQERP